MRWEWGASCMKKVVFAFSEQSAPKWMVFLDSQLEVDESWWINEYGFDLWYNFVVGLGVPSFLVNHSNLRWAHPKLNGGFSKGDLSPNNITFGLGFLLSLPRSIKIIKNAKSGMSRHPVIQHQVSPGNFWCIARQNLVMFGDLLSYWNDVCFSVPAPPPPQV